MKIKVKLCPLAKKHHEKSNRQFAHVFHHRNTICVTPEFYDLPKGYQVGILLHEIGHTLIGPTRQSEQDADDAIWKNGINIVRKNYRGMKNLEYVRTTDMKAALEFLDWQLT